MYKYSLLLLGVMGLLNADFSRIALEKQAISRQVDSLEYQKALGYYHDKQYEEALAGFDRVLIDDAYNLNAKIYYAKTLYHLSIYGEAEKVLKEVLKTDLYAREKAQIEKLLEAVEAKTKRDFFTTMLSLGAGYDDNINLTTDARETQYGGLTLINDTNKSNSTYGLASLSLSYRHHAESVDIVSSFYSYNEFAHSSKGNDLNYLNFSTGILKNIDNWSFLLPVGINGSYLDGSHIGYNLYANPMATYAFSKHTKSYIQISYIDNTTKFMAGRDYTMLGANVGVTYAKSEYKAGFYVGIADVNQKEDVRFDVEKDVLSASVFGKYFLFSRSFIATKLAWTQENYKVLDVAMGYKREDDTFSTGLTLGKYIGQNSLVQMDYMHRKNNSNVNAYSYDKNIYSIQYKYKF